MANRADRKEYRDLAKAEGKVYFEYVLDSVGNHNLGPYKSLSSVGVVSEENAKRLMDLIRHIHQTDQV